MMPAGPGEILAWDSRFFKMTIGRVKRREIDRVAFRTIRSWASQNAIDCLYFLSRKKQLAFPARPRGYSFYYLGNRVVLKEYAGAISVLIRPPESFPLRPVQISDVDFLVKIFPKGLPGNPVL